MRYKYEIKWGLIFMGISLAWTAFEKAIGWHGPKIDVHTTYTNFFALIAIGVYILAFLDRRKTISGPMQWKQGFFFGLGLALVVSILSPLTQWLATLISPEYFPNAIKYAVITNTLTLEKAEAYFNLQYFITQSMISAMMMGGITSAIVALFIQKKPPEVLG